MNVIWGQWSSLILLFRLLLLVVCMVTHIQAKTFKWYCAALWRRLVFIIIDHTALDPRHSILGRLQRASSKKMTKLARHQHQQQSEIVYDLISREIDFLCKCCVLWCVWNPISSNNLALDVLSVAAEWREKEKKLVKDDWPRELCSENKTSIICWEMMKNWNSSGDDEEKKQRVCVT